MAKENFRRLVFLADKSLAVQTTADQLDNGYYVAGAPGRYISYEEPAAVTELTPEICKQLLGILPRTVYAAMPYTSGLTGTDPEVFAFDAKGKVIPAWTYLKSNKENTAVYWDGVQAEVTVPPRYCHSHLSDELYGRLKMLYKILMAHDKDATLVAQDVVRLDRHTLMTAEDQHIMLGCAPSRNAYPRTKPIDIGDPREHAYRYSGTHLHYSAAGYNVPDWFPNGTVVMMDKILGLLLTALGRDWEDPRRRRAYGRAGEHRLPGETNARLEYRTPGSFILHHPALFNFAADMGRVAYRMGLLVDGRKFTEIPDVHKIINSCDADAALKVIESQSKFFSDIWATGNAGGAYSITRTMDVLRSGAKASGRFNGPLAENWRLDKTWTHHNANPGTTWVSALATA